MNGATRNPPRGVRRRRAGALLCAGWAALAPAVEPALEWFPPAGWEEQPSPLADPRATPGGELAVWAGDYPKSFNYYLDQNSFSADLFGALYESLLQSHPLTLALEPGLAARWAVGADGKTFLFELDPRARWSDGAPVTAADVVWTWQAVMAPAHMTGPHKLFLGRFDPPEATGERTVRFVAREAHWQNLDTLAGLQALPRHVFATQDFNRIHFELPVVSGPYRLEDIREGVSATLARRADWWARDLPRARGIANFQRLRFRFYAERDNAYEAFLKGQTDLFPVYTAHQWVQQTSGERFERNWIVKQRIVNRRPVGFQGFAMNQRRFPFDDVRTRAAMAMLLDRATLNRTLMFDQYFLHASYFEDLYDAAHPPPRPPTPFDPDRARALLAEAGWTVNPATRLLERDGRPFRFEFLSRENSTDKFLVIYQAALRDAGIEMTITKKDGSAWAKDMDEFHYDMTWAAWSAGLRKDPEPMWYSAEADRPSGQNITGFKNAAVDALIERQRTIFDVAARHEICREIDARLLAEHPYVLLWNINSARLLYWNKFGMPAQPLGKYGDERAAYFLWWHDDDRAAELDEARRDGLPLPARPADIRWDDTAAGGGVGK